MSKFHNTYQRIYIEKYRFLDTVTQPFVKLVVVSLIIAHPKLFVKNEMAKSFRFFLVEHWSDKQLSIND